MSKNNNNTNSTNNTQKRSGFSMGKISFYTLLAAAVLYLISMLLSVFAQNDITTVVNALKDVTLAIMVIIVSITAWRYVRNKPAIWKVLYFVILLVIIVCIIIPYVK